MKNNQNIFIVGQRVLLVPYRQDHVLKYNSWMQNAELRASTASEPLTLQEEYEMQTAWRQDSDKCTFIILSKSLFEQNGGDEIASMVGDVNLFLTKSEDDPPNENSKFYSLQAELDIMIAETKWRGAGLGKEASILMLSYGADILNIQTFYAKISDDNEASKILFEKMGFRYSSRSEIFKETTFILNLLDGADIERFNELRLQYPLKIMPYANSD